MGGRVALDAAGFGYTRGMIDLGPFNLDRIRRAVDKVQDRLRRVTSLLEEAGVAYAVIGGNAVAAWVSRVDESVVRYTQDVDVLIRREDLDETRAALEAGGFLYREAAGITMFLDGPDARARDAVHVLFAGERIREEYLLPAADVAESEAGEEYRVLSLEPLVRMKLTSNRDKDRTHVRDLISVGLVDQSWVDRLPSPTDERLQALLDDPDG